MKNKYLKYILLLTCVLFTLTGCCSSGGGSNHDYNPPSGPMEIPINPDGSVNFNSNDGFTLTAPKGSFTGYKLVFDRKTVGEADAVSKYKLDGTIPLSKMYSLKSEPTMVSLPSPATITITLDSSYNTDKKPYFALQKSNEWSLVSTNNGSNSSTASIRLATANVFALSFVDLPNNTMLCTTKKALNDAPIVYLRPNELGATGEAYTQNVDVDAFIRTLGKVDINPSNASFNLKIHGNKSLTHFGLKEKENKGVYTSDYNLLDIAPMISDNVATYSLTLNTKDTNSIQNPKLLVMNAIYKDANIGLPLSSQDKALVFKRNPRPTVVSAEPAKKEKPPVVETPGSVVITFSERMNRDSVEKAINILEGNRKFNDKTFVWSNSDKTVEITPNFISDNFEINKTYTVVVASSACNLSNVRIANNREADDPEDVKWSFSTANVEFNVRLMDPASGSVDIKIGTKNEATKIIARFSQPVIHRSVEEAFELYVGDFRIEGMPMINDARQELIFAPSEHLYYGTTYTVKVKKSAKSQLGSTLKEDFVAEFKTIKPFAKGSGTISDPYIVSNATELNNVRLAKIVSEKKYFKQSNDIDLSEFLKEKLSNNWDPIGNVNDVFNGNYDGNGKKITGLRINDELDNLGLFGHINNADIKNLTIVSPVINGKNNIGGLAGYATNSIISNICISEPKIQTNESCIGALIGKAENTTISNSNAKNSGLLLGKNCIGGLVGDAIKCNITNSTNEIMLTALGDYCGGIVGKASDNCKIEKCSSYSEISSAGNDCGGIVGAAIESCELLSCFTGYKAGDTTALTNVRGEQNVGGIAGRLDVNSVVSRCYTNINLGYHDISGQSQKTSSESVGGLVGNLVGNSTIIDSYSESELVVQGSIAGGIVGCSQDSKVFNTYALKPIKVGGEFVGGIVGTATNSNIKNSVAMNPTLSAASDDNTHGIVGSKDAITSLTNCYAWEDLRIPNQSEGKERLVDQAPNENNGTLISDATAKSGSSFWKNQLGLDTTVWTIISGAYPLLN